MKQIFAVLCTLWTTCFILDAAPRSESIESTEASFENQFKYSAEEPRTPKTPICRKSDSCHYRIYQDLDMNFCECPRHSHCGVSPPVHVSGTDYYLCGAHKTPTCKLGQTAMIVEGLQSTVLCSCRRRLIRGLHQVDYTEFTCGHARSKIWIKKMHVAGFQDQSERYVLN